MSVPKGAWSFLLASVIALSCLGDTSTSAETRGEQKPEPVDASRKQLSLGYSLLYQEASGLPKLNWLLQFKDKTDDMAAFTQNLVQFYQELAESLEKLSKAYPAVRIDDKPLSDIEGETRKAMGADMAKDLAPVAGKSGIPFEREALLMFQSSLNEQRHLVGVMLNRESVPSLKQYLETTKGQLEAQYTRVSSLLDRRYFTQK
jgi:hypothetical protein